MAGEKRKGKLRGGSGGVCEATLYEFVAAEENQEGSPVARVAANSIEEALAYVRTRFADFQIARVEVVGVVRLFSGSPVD